MMAIKWTKLERCLHETDYNGERYRLEQNSKGWHLYHHPSGDSITPDYYASFNEAKRAFAEWTDTQEGPAEREYNFLAGLHEQVKHLLVSPVLPDVGNDTAADAIEFLTDAMDADLEGYDTFEDMLETAAEYAATNPTDETAQTAVDMLSEEVAAAQESLADVLKSRLDAPASTNQRVAIRSLLNELTVGCIEPRNWFRGFVTPICGGPKDLRDLTVSEASQVEISLAAIRRARCYAGDLGIHAELNLRFKFDLYPTDPDRAKAEYAQATANQARVVSGGRTGNPRLLTKAEAIVYTIRLQRFIEQGVFTNV